MTAWPWLGSLSARIGLGRLPEEITPPPALRALMLPAIETGGAVCRGRARSEVVFDAFRTARGVIRSLRIYYGDRSRAPAMDRLYGEFVRRGDLVFDVGAHVGDRVASFRRLGARVVAVEPQPALVRLLRLIYGRSRDVVIEPVAVGRAVGSTRIMINRRQPDGFDGLAGFHQRGARCARAGKRSAGRDRWSCR